MAENSTTTTAATTTGLDDYEKLDWEAAGGELREIDDGHTPEIFKGVNDDNVPTRIVEYHSLFQRPPQVRVYRNAVDDDIVDALYEKTHASEHPAWGDYVTIQQVRDYWNHQGTPNHDHHDDVDDSLLVKVVARYLELAVQQENGDNNKRYEYQCFGDDASSRTSTCLFTEKDLEQAHGVAVWSLRSLKGSQVDYHLDYAEQIRYHSNIIVPPLLAGTLQCTKDELDGGDFKVSLDGISHYETHGYKTKKRPLDNNSNNNMIEIPYRYNQMICHLGNLPHSSTKVTAIHGTQERVIVGFNVFCHASGPLVQRAPEHSDQFRRAIHLQRYLRQKTKSKSQMSLESVKENKALSKLLVLAKRERVKQEYKLAQERLAQEVPTKLPATVGELIQHFSKENVPSDDIRVFLHHSVLRGQLRIVNGCKESTDGLVSPLAELAVV